MRALALALLLSTTALAGDAVQFCVGERTGSMGVCVPTFAELASEQDGQLFALDALGNVGDWGLFCSWRGVWVRGPADLLTITSCDEAKRRLDQAAEALTRAELVQRDEWPRVISSALRVVVLYPSRVLEAPRGEELVEGVYVPDEKAIHLTATMVGAPHELFHAVLAIRGGSIDHDQFPSRIDFLSRVFREKFRARPL